MVVVSEDSYPFWTEAGWMLENRLLLIAVIAAIAVGQARQGLALEDRRIGVLYVSDPIRSPAFTFMRAEPIFSLTFVAASLRGFGGWDLDDVHRAIRLYFPRMYQDLTSRFDVVVLDNANQMAITPEQIELLARGVREAGIGLLMTGGWESFGGTGTAQPSWGPTAIGALLPVQCVDGTWVESGRLVIDEPEHEFVASIPWDRKGPFMQSFHHNLVTVREGGQLLAHTDRNRYQPGGDHPLFITWEVEGARVFACTGEIVQMASIFSYGGTNYDIWEYYGDFISNLMIYLDKRPVPQDVDLVHAVRSTAFQSRTRVSLLLSLVEFVESFGANGQGVMRSVDELNGVVAQADGAYLDLNFEEVLEIYRRIGTMLDDIEKQALELKDRTLLWVYLVEWLAVTGTALLAGFILWTTMVRRRFYKEMKVTRIAAL